jgi:polyketide synthase 12
VPFYSTLTGGVIDTATLDAGYWYRNLRERVLFAPVVGSLLDAGFGLFVEASAHPVLTMGISECAEAAGASAVAVGSLRREDGGPERFLVSVAEAWAHGASVDWSALTSAGAAIVDLPTYAFQRDRYWLELRTATGVEGWREPSSIGSWRYQVTWRAVEGGSPSARLDGRWLVLVLEDADPGVARWCREALEEHGAKVLVIDGGGLDRDPLAAMLRLAAADGLVGVMALTGLDEGVSARVLVLVQALGDAGVEAPLWCVTQGAVSVGPDDVVAPVQAQVWGLGRVVGLEHPGRWGGLIDLPCSVGGLDGLAGSSKPGEKSGETGASADQVARDFVAVLSGDVGEDQVAIREQGLFARRLSRAPLGELSAEPWRPAGTVLVTGSGRIADRVARWLLDQGAEHVALAGPAKVAGLDRAEVSDLGDRVTVGDLDPADREALAAFLERLAAQGNPVRALVHTAAGTTLAPIVDVTPADLAETFAATVSPAVHALDLLPGIEAAIVFSSVSGVWGTGEHAAFAAANAHLDALAAQQRANGAPITAVSWGIWNTLSPEATGGHDPAEDSSSNSKVAAAAPAAAETEAAEAAITLLARHGTPPLDPDRALEALDQIVRRGESGLVVADVEWGRFTALFGSVRESRLFVEVAGSGGSGFEGSSGAAVGGVRDRLSGLSGAERERVLVELVCGHSAAALGHSAAGVVDAGRAFKELGFDSLIAVELRNRLSQATGLSLPPTLVFDYPTPAAVAGYLAGQLDESAAVTAATIRGQVKAVEDAVAAAALSEDEQHGIAALLEDLLERWRAAGEHGGSALADDALDEASDDELFEFIHSEFGRPALG